MKMNYRTGVAALMAAVLLVACGAGEETVFSETPSPYGPWTLRITVAESRMPGGPFHVGAYVAGENEAPGTKVIDTTLENDGVPFTRTNIAARWISPGRALVCLRATDRPDRGMRVEVGDPPRAVEVDQC